MLTDHERQADLEAEQARMGALDYPAAPFSVSPRGHLVIESSATDQALSGLVQMLCESVSKLEARVNKLEAAATVAASRLRR